MRTCTHTIQLFHKPILWCLKIQGGKGCGSGRQLGTSMAAIFQVEQINRPHFAQAFSWSQNCNVTINLESCGYTQPMQELNPPDAGKRHFYFYFFPFPLSDKHVHMLRLKFSWSPLDNWRFGEVSLQLYSLCIGHNQVSGPADSCGSLMLKSLLYI